MSVAVFQENFIYKYGQWAGFGLQVKVYDPSPRPLNHEMEKEDRKNSFKLGGKKKRSWISDFCVIIHIFQVLYSNN